MASQSKFHYLDNDLEWSFQKGYSCPQAIRVTDSKSTKNFDSDETNIVSLSNLQIFFKSTKIINFNWNLLNLMKEEHFTVFAYDP